MKDIARVIRDHVRRGSAEKGIGRMAIGTLILYILRTRVHVQSEHHDMHERCRGSARLDQRCHRSDDIERDARSYDHRSRDRHRTHDQSSTRDDHESRRNISENPCVSGEPVNASNDLEAK